MDYKDKVIKLLTSKELTEEQKSKLLDIFPELKESEDERIRKAIINVFVSHKDYENFYGVSVEDILAWLERQAEQNPADKVEPKFHKGDWIVHHGTENIYQVVARIYNQYQLKYGDNYTIQNCADVDRCARLWDITKDAKDGDVLASDSDGVCIFDGTLEEDKYPFAYCGITKRGFDFYNVKLPFSNDNIHPATKEQRDLLFQKMKEAEYEWSDKDRKLIKIDEKQIKKNLQDNGFRRMFEQKPADKVEPKFKVKYADSEYNVFETKDIAGVTFYGIEDEPNHIDYVKADNCEIISGGYGIKENGSPYPTKPAVFSEQKPVCSEESLSDIENRIINFAMQFHDNRMKLESEWADEIKMLRDIIPSIHKTS